MQSKNQKTSFTSILDEQIATKVIVSLFFTCLFFMPSRELSAQYRRLTVGAGVTPLHRPGQTDFTAVNMPYDIYAAFFQGNIGLRVDYNWNGSYEKERFSTTNQSIEASLQYSFRQFVRKLDIDPYARIGVAKWNTTLTTEGYPGINDYEFKIEEDSGYGVVTGIGANYIYRQFSFGIEAQFAKLGTAMFIAGGFEPQPLITDQFRLMVTAAYTFPITSDAKGGIVYCPTF